MTTIRPLTSALGQIGRIDYTVVPCVDLEAMRRFYEAVMGFVLTRRLSERWYEYQLGETVLALTTRGGRFAEATTPPGAAALQLAFRVPAESVAECASELLAKGIVLAAPVTDQPFGHRTVFFRDPDGNVIEIYGEI
jgi:lactoylglutathione lyase